MRVPSPRGLVLLVLLACPACGGKDASAPPPPAQKISDVAATYLNAALDVMQQHSINKYKVNWTVIRSAALQYAGTAQNAAETYPAIRSALQQLGDNHSGFYPPGTWTSVVPVSPAGTTGIVGDLSARRIDGVVGYLAIPGYSGTTNPAPFADSIQHLIALTDDSALCGWVVDLRGNPGGNMWPMLAGVGPILGEGDAGSVVDADGNRGTWYYQGGASGIRPTYVSVRVSPPWPYTLRRTSPRVAVLTGPKTASSGEAITVSFRGRPDTRSFGEPTYGLSSANSPYQLSDGAVLNLTVALDADRTGKLYGAEITPDSLVIGTATVDAALNAGVAWVKTAAICKG